MQIVYVDVAGSSVNRSMAYFITHDERVSWGIRSMRGCVGDSKKTYRRSIQDILHPAHYEKWHVVVWGNDV